MSEEREYSFTWKIKNFLSCTLEKGKHIESPTFIIENLSDSRWCLWFYPKGDGRLKNEQRFVSCFLKFFPQKSKSVTICFALAFVDEKGRVLKSEMNARDRNFNDVNATWGWPTFFDIDDLYTAICSSPEDVVILRCRIKYTEECKQKLLRSTACTTFNVHRCCVDWYVKMPILFEYSDSVCFRVSDSYKFEVTVKSGSGALSILINFTEGSAEISRQVTFTISIFNKIGCKIGSKRAVHVYEKSETWKFPDFVTRQQLNDCKIDSFRYEFKLKVEVCIPVGDTFINRAEGLEFESPSSLKSIPSENPVSVRQQEYRSIFFNKNYSDVKLRCTDGEFPAHKLVLRVRSPVFAAMFDKDMLENETGIVDITDLDSKTLKAFLEFLYTETVDKMDYDVAKDLIVAADKYQVTSLVEECSSFLKSVMSANNVFELISIADLINCESLKSYAFNYIKVNATQILPSTEWSKWIEKNVQLATYILTKLSTALSAELEM